MRVSISPNKVVVPHEPAKLIKPTPTFPLPTFEPPIHIGPIINNNIPISRIKFTPYKLCIRIQIITFVNNGLVGKLDHKLLEG